MHLPPQWSGGRRVCPGTKYRTQLYQHLVPKYRFLVPWSGTTPQYCSSVLYPSHCTPATVSQPLYPSHCVAGTRSCDLVDIRPCCSSRKRKQAQPLVPDSGVMGVRVDDEATWPLLPTRGVSKAEWQAAEGRQGTKHDSACWIFSHSHTLCIFFGCTWKNVCNVAFRLFLLFCTSVFENTCACGEVRKICPAQTPPTF